MVDVSPLVMEKMSQTGLSVSQTGLSVSQKPVFVSQSRVFVSQTAEIVHSGCHRRAALGPPPSAVSLCRQRIDAALHLGQSLGKAGVEAIQCGGKLLVDQVGNDWIARHGSAEAGKLFPI